MKADATLRFVFPTPADASAACRSLEPDNGAFLEGRTEGATLVLTAKAGSALGLLRTLEDAINCLRALGGQEAVDE